MLLDGVNVPERPGEIRACLVVRNEALRLPSVLDHHRKLGVDRFLIVDNGSTDGTLDYLSHQNDIHTFRQAGSFGAAEAGKVWINTLLDAFCHDHWTLTLDADEFFVFPGYERISLRDFCGFLDVHAVRGAFALMIDMYGAGDISEATHVPGRSLLETCPWFDPAPYEIVKVGLFPPIQFMGGPRARAFDFSAYQPRPPALSKVPLVKWRRGMKYLLSTHAITPTSIYPMLTALLHFKFLSDFPERVGVAMREGQHYGGSKEYRAYSDTLRANGGLLRLHNAQSVAFTGSDQLVALRLMQTNAAYDAFLEGALSG